MCGALYWCLCRYSRELSTVLPTSPLILMLRYQRPNCAFSSPFRTAIRGKHLNDCPTHFYALHFLMTTAAGYVVLLSINQ